MSRDLEAIDVMARSHEIDLVEDLDGLMRLRSEWNELAPARNVEPWQSFIWAEAAAVACSSNHRLHVMALRTEGRLVAVAPLVLKSSEQPLRPMRMDFLGGEELKEPSRFVSLDASAVDLLVSAIASERTYPIRLSRLLMEGDGLDALVAKFRKSGWITRVLDMPYPYLELGPRPFRRSLREDLRRASKKASVRGEIRVEIVGAAGVEELRDLLETAFRIEASGWKGRMGTAVLSNEARKRFFEQYALSALDEGILRLSFLCIDDLPIAVQYGVEAANAFWLLKIGYDEVYRECSPGNLLLEESIKAAVASGLARYNLLGRDEPWVRRWTKTVQECQVVAAYRPNWHGVRAALSDTLYLLGSHVRRRRVNEAKRVT